MNNNEQAAPPVSSEQDNVTDLDRIMTDGRASFDDAVAPEDAAPAAPAQEADLLIGEPGKDLTPPQDQKPPEPPPTQNQPAATRFKSHEEAEKGYQHLQRDKTMVDQRVAALTEELQRIKSQEQAKQERDAEETAFMDFAQSRNEQALKEIDELDPDDPEYRKKAASAWARANKDIRYFSNTSGKPPQSPSAAPNQQAAPPAPEAADAALSPPDQDASAKAVSYVKEKLTAAKIPQDDLLFWKIARDVPATDPQGKPLDLDTQINWAIAETQNYRAAILGNTGISPDAAAEADRKARATQAQHLPLGHSPADRAAVTPPAAPVSMTDAISFAQEQRRL